MARTTKPTAKYIILLISSVAVIVFTFGIYFIKNKGASTDPLVREKPFPIYQSEVDYLMAVHKLTIPQKTDREFAIQQLEEIKIYEKIMNQYGWEITASDLEKEKNRIAQNTRLPGLLKQVQDIPEHGKDYYTQIFIKETLIKRSIFDDFYFSIPELHKNTKELALKFMEQNRTKDIKTIFRLAWDNNYEVFEFKISPRVGVEVQHRPNPNSTAKQFSDNNLPEKGEIKKGNTELEVQDWYRVHSSSLDKKTYLFEEREKWNIYFIKKNNRKNKEASGFYISISKQPFNEWIQKEIIRYK